MSKRGSERAKYAKSHEISRHAGAHMQSARHQPAPDRITEAMRLYTIGEITWEEAERRSQEYIVQRDRAQAARAAGHRAPDPRRARPAPDNSRQWCRPMATQAARDDRLTPNAKALLQVIVAEIGDHGQRMLATAYLAKRVKRSARQVRRYLAQLRDRGYIHTKTVQGERTGLDIGKVVTVVATAVRPFWHPACKPRRAQTPGNRGRTQMSPTNSSPKRDDQSTRHTQAAEARLSHMLAQLAQHLRADTS